MKILLAVAMVVLLSSFTMIDDSRKDIGTSPDFNYAKTSVIGLDWYVTVDSVVNWLEDKRSEGSELRVNSVNGYEFLGVDDLIASVSGLKDSYYTNVVFFFHKGRLVRVNANLCYAMEQGLLEGTPFPNAPAGSITINSGCMLGNASPVGIELKALAQLVDAEYK